jgi:hypothetical protein
MKKFIFICLLFLLPFNIAYAQYESSAQPASIGVSVNILGPIFGEYSLGVSTFINPFIQVGVNSTYYDTQYVSPEVEGWQSDLRVNYFFSSFRRSGFFLGASGGFEAVNVKKNDNAKWERFEDATWAVIPGYAWMLGKSYALLLGLSYGYSLGDMQLAPEINFVISL